MAYAPLWPELDRNGWLRGRSRWGGPIEEIRPGDVVSFTPGEKHWHGAAPAMTHIAIQEQLDSRSAEWMERSQREQYQGDEARQFQIQDLLDPSRNSRPGYPLRRAAPPKPK